MDVQDKLKYEKARYTVKKWEKQFKATTNQCPTKADIKNASTKIKDAYRTYWKLKTEILQNSICDLDENATDCFNSSSENYDSQILNKSVNDSDSVYFKTVGESTQLESVTNESQTSEDNISKQNSELLNFKILSFKKELEKQAALGDQSSIWGAHLSKKQPIEQGNKTIQRSISFQYAEKLFKGAKTKFNLRNPRKPRAFTKAKTTDNVLESSSSISHLNSVQEDVSPISDLSTISKSDISFLNSTQNSDIEISEPNIESNENQKPSCFKLLDEKTKVIIKSSPKTQNIAVNLLQKTFEEQRNIKVSKPLVVDEGWLARVSEDNNLTTIKKNENLSCDSGIEKSDDATSGTNDSKPCSVVDDDSGEELIYDSDTESKTITGRTLNLIRISSSSRNINNKRPLEKEQNNIESQIKKIKTNDTNYKAFTTKPEILKSNNTIVKKNNESTKNIKNEEKLLLLEKKLETGKANENFVSINIEKKVFVKGRKRTTYSKYKKQKWKSLKRENNENNSRSILKCFKCGDIGHFSKACPSAGKELLPLEDYDSSEESPFPTLSEVAEMAKEAAEIAHKNGRKFTVDKEALPQQSEQISETESYEFVEPLYNLSPDGSLIETPEEVWDALRDFGHSQFLPGQEKAIMRILSGQSTLVTLSTGSGKSLCYQLPAYLFSIKRQPCITLVVSPLVSLMEDQVFCGAKCMQIACIHMNQTEKKRQTILNQLKEGNVSVLLISPETLVSWDTGIAKQIAAIIPRISFACIDEAHCLYQWCHNFRPSYLTVTQVLQEKLGVKTLLGLTATASINTVQSLMSHLGIAESSYSEAHITDTPLPDNLILSVSLTQSDHDRQTALIDLLQDKFAHCSSIIVYCTRRETCEKVAGFLRTALQSNNAPNKQGRLSLHAEIYHAGMTAARRNQVQKAFMTGKLRIVVATVAFGMGINKNDIRAIIHYNMPSTYENYVQEVGRAGRDKKTAYCHLFLDEKKEDIGEVRKHIYSDTIDRHIIRKLLQLVFFKCNCKEDEICTRHEVAFSVENTVSLLDLPQENISTLLAYLQLDAKQWIKVLPLAYTTCSVSSYKGSRHLREVAKTCPPLAMVIATQENMKTAALSFDIIKLSRDINWDSGIVKQSLKKLEWNIVNDKPAKSGIQVDFSKLGFRVLSPGNLTDSQLDESLDIIHSTVVKQEKNKLVQLQSFYNSLYSVAFKTTRDCMNNNEDAVKRSEFLKTNIRHYFSNPELIKDIEPEQVQLSNIDCISADIQRLIHTYRSENNLTGRSIARILHGIGSPNFPPIVWGRTFF